MWEALLNLFRKPEEQSQAEQPEGAVKGASEYQIRRIRPDSYRIYEFQADLVYVPTNTTVTTVRGDSEKDLRREARAKADADIYRRSMLGRDLDL